MIRAIAIDDEPLALTIIEHLCMKNADIVIEKTFTSQQDALQYLDKFPVDLMFLDIQMPEKDGISFYKSLEVKPMVIFTTAFDHYAVEGFNVNAVDYLLKPVAYERFETAVEKAKKVKQFNANTNQDAFILIRADYKLNKIPIKDILFIEGLDDYIQIHIEGKSKIVARMSMKNIMELLPASEFIRIHRSFIVPIRKVTSVQTKQVHIGEREFPVGETYKSNVLSLLTDKN